MEEIQKKIEELERWHTDRINENIKNPFAYTSKLICHNCDHKDDYIEELEAEIEEYRAIGTVEELEAMKKGTLSAMELADIWCVLEDLKKYSAIGTVEDFKALKEKSEPKKADYKKMVYPSHKWKMEDGKIDIWAYEAGYCNGPVCERCYYFFCEHCNPNGYEGECVIEDYICPSCRENVGYKQTHCKCGQKLDWSE